MISREIQVAICFFFGGGLVSWMFPQRNRIHRYMLGEWAGRLEPMLFIPLKPKSTDHRVVLCTKLISQKCHYLFDALVSNFGEEWIQVSVRTQKLLSKCVYLTGPKWKRTSVMDSTPSNFLKIHNQEQFGIILITLPFTWQYSVMTITSFRNNFCPSRYNLFQINNK